MKIKKLLLMLFLLITLLTLPVTCNAEEVPTMKWEDISTNYSDTYYLGDKLYNINNDILIVHNSSLFSDNYTKLFSN